MTPKLTDEQIDKWIEEAKKATQGGWSPRTHYGKEGHWCLSSVNTSEGEEEICSGDSCCVNIESNVIHIANACPQNFIAVLEELMRHRKRKHFEDVRCGGIGVEIQ